MTSRLFAQFLISSVMIIGSIVVAMQMGFIQRKDPGFDKDQIAMLTLNDTAIISSVTVFMQEIERHPAVKATALSTTAHSYLSDELNALYQEERIVFPLVISFTALIIFIASLGLLDLYPIFAVVFDRCQDRSKLAIGQGLQNESGSLHQSGVTAAG